MITVSIKGLGDHPALKVELSALPRVGEEICVGGALFDVVAVRWGIYAESGTADGMLEYVAIEVSGKPILSTPQPEA